MFENYFATVRRGQRIENNCTLLRNLLKVMGKPMSMREIRKEIPSIQLTNHMIQTLVRSKALKREIRAEEIIDKPYKESIRCGTAVSHKDGTITGQKYYLPHGETPKIYNGTVDTKSCSWHDILIGTQKVQVKRAYYEWIGD